MFPSYLLLCYELKFGFHKRYERKYLPSGLNEQQAMNNYETIDRSNRSSYCELEARVKTSESSRLDFTDYLTKTVVLPLEPHHGIG